jgi:glycerol-3-phosphate acyltransferase PlsY
MTEAALLVVAAYVIGSLPLGWIVVRAATGVDLRRTGSGNVGATNAWRSSSPVLGGAVALMDVLKGVAAVLLARRLAPVHSALAWQAAAAVGATVGHVAPVWLAFRGGRGVATAAGAFLVVAPAACGLAVAVFAAVVWWTRYVSLGSLAAAVTLGAVALARAPRVVALAALAVAGLIVVTHRDNIGRLRAGTEPRLGRSA